MQGLYKVDYDINGAAARSVMYADGGRMFGGNTAFAHRGSYRDADRDIVGEVHTWRHSASPKYKSLVGPDDVTIRFLGRAEGARYRFHGDVVERPGAVFRALMTPLGGDDTPPPGAVGDGGIVSGLYAVEIRMLDGLAGGNTGVMLLLDGRIFGGDAFFYYLGAYSSANGRWKGEFVNQEHTPARSEHPLFGGHQVGIGFSGRCDAVSAEAEATALVGKRSIRFAAQLRLLQPIAPSGHGGGVRR